MALSMPCTEDQPQPACLRSSKADELELMFILGKPCALCRRLWTGLPAALWLAIHPVAPLGGGRAWVLGIACGPLNFWGGGL